MEARMGRFITQYASQGDHLICIDMYNTNYIIISMFHHYNDSIDNNNKH